MNKRFTNIEIDNRGDIILLDDNGVFTVYNLQELEDLLNNQDQRIRELATKMNYQAFELYKYGVVSIGKAVELSNMSYHDFIKYCADNGHPVELRL